MTYGYEYEAQDGIEYEYLTGEEGCIDEAEAQEEYESPHIAVSEVFSTLLCASALEVEGEAEEESKDGVGLSAKGEEEHVPEALIEVNKGGIVFLWEGIEIEVLNVVQQHDGHDCKASQCVDGKDSFGWLFFHR